MKERKKKKKNLNQMPLYMDDTKVTQYKDRRTFEHFDLNSHAPRNADSQCIPAVAVTFSRPLQICTVSPWSSAITLVKPRLSATAAAAGDPTICLCLGNR